MSSNDIAVAVCGLSKSYTIAHSAAKTHYNKRSAEVYIALRLLIVRRVEGRCRCTLTGSAKAWLAANAGSAGSAPSIPQWKVAPVAAVGGSSA